MSDNFNKERIIKNTALLYLRMAFTMWLNLYATRLVLKNLGIDDMGVYGVVGSIVSLFSVFTNGISTAIQRFITFELGKKDGKVNTVFCTSINIIFLISGVVFLLLETLGVWYLTNKANIPSQSVHAAFWVFQISVLTCIVNLISVPYSALIIAHEKMNVFAFISIIQVTFTCIAAFSLSYFNTNRLLIYAILLAGIGILIRITYQVYSQWKFKEAQYHWIIDKRCMKDMGKFAGITTFSNVLQTISAQGIVLVINATFGVAINAVYSIALQLKNSVLSFSQNIAKAVSPQITKTYAEKDYDTHKQLVYRSTKYQVFLIYFLLFPFLFKTEYILQLWLENTPEYTIQFCQCIVFLSLINTATSSFSTSAVATNKVTGFYIIPELFCLISIPIGYLSYIIYKDPTVFMIVIVTVDIIARLIQTYIATKVSVITIHSILKESIYPTLKVAFVSLVITYILSLYTPNTILGLCIYILCNSLQLLAIIYILGITKYEKAQIIQYIREKSYVLFRGKNRLKKEAYKLYHSYYSPKHPNASNQETLVIFMCDGKRSHGGLADRIRGLISTYNLCKELNLKFKIHFISPFNLHKFLIPNKHDWVIDESAISHNSNDSICIYGDCTEYNGEKIMLYNYFKHHLIKYSRCYKQIHIYSTIDLVSPADFSILFHELFTPSVHLSTCIEQYIKDINGKYITLSFRFTQLLGDLKDSHGIPLSPEEKNQLIKRCKKSIEKIHLNAPTHNKVIVTSDSPTFLSKITDLSYINIIPGSIGHIDNNGTTESVHLKTFLDMFIIANAEKAYMVRTKEMYPSGFARRAAMINNIPFEEYII